MYLAKFEVENIKCFENVALEFPKKSGNDYSGWTVLLGGNGTGKSTLLQGMAIGLVGPTAGQRLLYDPDGWARATCDHGRLNARIVKGPGDSASGKPRQKPYRASFAVTGDAEIQVDGRAYDQPQLVQFKSDRPGLSGGPYAANRHGWFCCGYGPFRRLTGMGGGDVSGLLYSPGKEKRFVTLFREDAAITNCADWLVSLYSRSVDPSLPGGDRLKSDLELIRGVIDSLLPGDVHIAKVDSTDVSFSTIGGVEVAVSDLSDGYRSFLALAVDVLRHVHESSSGLSSVVEDRDGKARIVMEGVVLIDEVDAHLHPRWQREIGFRLCQAFPKMQFIVTSHSPFVAQAAEDNGLFVLSPSEGTGVVKALRPVKSVRGWRADQILTQKLLFALDGTRDEETEAFIRKHAELVAKREWTELSPDEQRELGSIEEKLADRLTGPGETTEELKQQEAMQQYVSRTLAELKGNG